MKLSVIFQKRKSLVPMTVVCLSLVGIGGVNAESGDTSLNTLPFYDLTREFPSPIGELTLPQVRIDDDKKGLYEATIKFDWLSSQFFEMEAREIPRATETSWDEGFDVTIATQLQALLDKIVTEYKQPGAVIRVDMKGNSWRGVAGVSRYDKSRGNQPRVFSDKYRMGSITKMVIASIVLDLVEDESLDLDLDDTLDKFFAAESWYKDMPNGDVITVRQLLNMQSGLANYIPLKEFQCDPITPIPVAELLKPAFELGSQFPPGEKGKWLYSNTNYLLLGILIENVTKKAVIDVFNRRLLIPLKVFNTLFPDRAAIPYYYASGYTTLSCPTDEKKDDINPLNLNEASFMDPSLPWTAGGMISNVNDLTTIVKAQATGTHPPLSAELLKERFEFIETDHAFPKYGKPGYGLGIYEFNGYYGHIGQILGFDSGAFYNPREDISIVINMNGYPSIPTMDIDGDDKFDKGVESLDLVVEIFQILDGTWTRTAQ